MVKAMLTAGAEDAMPMIVSWTRPIASALRLSDGWDESSWRFGSDMLMRTAVSLVDQTSTLHRPHCT